MDGWEVLLLSLGWVLVFEGISPLIAPERWLAMLAELTKADPKGPRNQGRSKSHTRGGLRSGGARPCHYLELSRQSLLGGSPARKTVCILCARLPLSCGRRRQAHAACAIFTVASALG